ncbi:hypothetical protein JYU14_02035 [Simkania negevensis]|uniref:Uncharacterized protein n=1 Tax=Simkania negevensis TaxID=83561 RepID=A0ABS3AQ49_9BACT|nr:hypothetical protein [Simkania negevensis]
MKIDIALRLKPFSTHPGAFVPLPGSVYGVQIFPTRLCVYDLKTADRALLMECSHNIRGPFDNFATFLDLEKECIRVFGHCPAGLLRYDIRAVEKGSNLAIDTGRSKTEEKLKWSVQANKGSVREDASTLFWQDDNAVTTPISSSMERLALGCHKKQDWEGVVQRKDIREFLPFWFRLGSIAPALKDPIIKEGTASLLTSLEKAIAASDPQAITPTLSNIFACGFCGILFPRLIDNDYQGIVDESTALSRDASPLVLLKEGARLIRSLFIRQEKEVVQILPSVPAELYCGRLTGIACPDIGIIEIEWSKKKVRRLKIYAEHDGNILLAFKGGIKRFRVRRNRRDIGFVMQVGTPLAIQKGTAYDLDLFEK